MRPCAEKRAGETAFTIVTVVKKVLPSIPAEFAIYAPLPLPSDATEIAAWMTQACRLTRVLEEGAMA